MYKIFLAAILLILTFRFSSAQDLSYGPLLGVGVFGTHHNHGGVNATAFSPEKNETTLYFGGYLEYGFSKKMGVKSEFNFTNFKLWRYLNDSQLITRLSYFDISPSFKYNFGAEYNKGFYMLIGPRFSFLTRAKIESSDVDDDFESVNIGLQLGFGQRVFKFIDIQVKVDYGATPFFRTKQDSSKNSKWLGVFMSLNLDLQKMLL